MKNKSDDIQLLTFGGHLEMLRKMLRIVLVIVVFTILIFSFKEWTFQLLLAPREWNFATYRCIEEFVRWCGFDFRFEPYQIDLISTELASQFMMHISSSVYLALLGASPYILYELFRFISPALYENEKKYSLMIVVSMYVLFGSIDELLHCISCFIPIFRNLSSGSVHSKYDNLGILYLNFFNSDICYGTGLSITCSGIYIG